MRVTMTYNSDNIAIAMLWCHYRYELATAEVQSQQESKERQE